MGTPATHIPVWLSVKEVAKAAKTTEWTVREKIKSGELRASKVFGMWKVDLEDLQAYFDQNVPTQNAPNVRPLRPRPSAPAGSLREANQRLEAQ